MIKTELDQNIHTAGLKAFALAQREIESTLVETKAAKPGLISSLRAEVVLNTGLMKALDRNRLNLPFQDEGTLKVFQEIVKNGTVMKKIILSRACDALTLHRVAGKVLKDADFLMDIMDISRKQGIKENEGISMVVDVAEHSVRTMIGSLTRLELLRSMEEGLREEYGRSSWKAYLNSAELMITSIIPDDMLVPTRREYNI